MTIEGERKPCSLFNQKVKALVAPVLFVCAGFCLSARADREDLPPVIREAKPFKGAAIEGAGILWTHRSKVTVGTSLECFLEFECWNGADRLRYPWMPAITYQLHVFDQDHNYLGDICAARSSGPLVPSDAGQGPSNAPTIAISSDRAIGVVIPVPTGTKSTVAKRMPNGMSIIAHLGPGNYFLQGAFSDDLIGPPSTGGVREFLWSNVLALEVTVIRDDQVSASERLMQQDRKLIDAVIRVDQHEVMVGDPFTIRMRVINRSQHPVRLHNPFIDPLLARRSSELRIFNARGDLLGDCFMSFHGSIRRERPGDWMALFPGSFCGTRSRMKAGLFTFRPVHSLTPDQNTTLGDYYFEYAYSDPEKSPQLAAVSEKVRVTFGND